MSVLHTPRLTLVPLTLSLFEAVMEGRREDAEALVGARMPQKWPNLELVERAFSASLDAIRARPEAALWGGRVMISREGEPLRRGADAARAHTLARGQTVRRVLGSVTFHGKPGGDGIAEIAYGVEEASQGQGYATEGVAACVAWALAQEGVRLVQAATFPWHRASMRVIEKVGMVRAGVREHETMGELLVFERRR